ncbi:MAG: T9SS type A sorting domain-containing protein [Candidatus Marinimicrobia bacterium]|nr:T9SS type A sorting domain-containing protein [Candidatus Neomarinimicrobiota bacterium]
MKKMLAVSLVLCAAVAFAGPAGYYFGELMYNFNGADSVKTEYTLLDGSGGHQTSPHSVVVDPDGKVWIGYYYGYTGQIENALGDTLTLKGMRIFMPDGTPATFSPIEYLEFDDGSKDTIYGESAYNGSCRGMSAMANGDILFTAWSTIYKIDYTTGEGIAMWNPPMDGHVAGSMTEAAHDPELGLIYAGRVSSNKPIYVLDEDLAYVGIAVDTCPTLHRSIIARTTSTGMGQIFSGTIWNGQGIFVYESDDPEFTMFELVDTLGNYDVDTDSNTITYKAWASCLDWVDVDEGVLVYGNYQSAKVYVDVATAPANTHSSKWIIFDVDDDAEVAQFGAKYSYTYDVTENTASDSLDNQPATWAPRGASVKVAGDHYEFVIADFDLSTIQKVVWSADGLEGNDRFVPYGFVLEQNYPNPFNPTTSISFRIPESFDVAVDVYDLAGTKVATVYSGRMDAGTHNMTFDASNLASGTYVYQLTAGEFTVSRKMTLVK